MNSKTASTYNKTALSRYRIRGLLIGAGVIAALISSFSGSASLRSGSDPLGSKDRQGSLVATVPKFNPMVMPRFVMAVSGAMQPCRTPATTPPIG
jgi:hypothetical protein